jgi:hypothetical protein
MTSIDFKTIPANVPSMCIPRVFKNITRERVMSVIRDLDLGLIDHIDMVQRENEKGDKFQRVFIHFKKWHSNPNANKAREMLISGKEIKIIYDDPWFWKISANKSISGGAAAPSAERKPTISFDESPRERQPKRFQKRDQKREPRREEKKPEPEAPTFVPRSPSNSPPRRSCSPSPISEPVQSSNYVCDPPAMSIDYGVLPVIPKKKRIIKKPVDSVQAPTPVLEIKEEGEL